MLKNMRGQIIGEVILIFKYFKFYYFQMQW